MLDKLGNFENPLKDMEGKVDNMTHTDDLVSNLGGEWQTWEAKQQPTTSGLRKDSVTISLLQRSSLPEKNGTQTR